MLPPGSELYWQAEAFLKLGFVNASLAGRAQAAIPVATAAQGPQPAALYTGLAILLPAESPPSGSVSPTQLVAPGKVRAEEIGLERKSSCNTEFTGRLWNEV
jgi:hypothetical protein